MSTGSLNSRASADGYLRERHKAAIDDGQYWRELNRLVDLCAKKSHKHSLAQVLKEIE
jgi:hypothetical protein